MKALVVFESTVGDTRHVADAIADGLRQSIETDVLVVADAFNVDFADVKLVVAGAPSEASRRSRPNSPAVAPGFLQTDQQAESASLGAGIREWLRGLPRPHGCRGVAFDTHDRQITGYEARAIQGGLRAAGFASFGDPHSFRVAELTDASRAEELERARQWGEAMGRMLVGMSMSWRWNRTCRDVGVPSNVSSS